MSGSRGVCANADYQVYLRLWNQPSEGWGPVLWVISKSPWWRLCKHCYSPGGRCLIMRLSSCLKVLNLGHSTRHVTPNREPQGPSAPFLPQDTGGTSKESRLRTAPCGLGKKSRPQPTCSRRQLPPAWGPGQPALSVSLLRPSHRDPGSKCRKDEVGADAQLDPCLGLSNKIQDTQSNLNFR